MNILSVELMKTNQFLCERQMYWLSSEWPLPPLWLGAEDYGTLIGDTETLRISNYTQNLTPSYSSVPQAIYMTD